jgi:integral membrane sensor domain MASE1
MALGEENPKPSETGWWISVKIGMLLAIPTALILAVKWFMP